MAESESGQEKTEEATPKRREDARKKGQVPRSRELSTLMLLMLSAIAMMGFGQMIATESQNILRESFSPPPMAIFDPGVLLKHVIRAVNDAFFTMLPFLLATVIVTLLTPALIGGFSFSLEAMQPKLEKLDPVKGLQRVFSLKGLMELVKALAKFLLVSFIAVFIIWIQLPSLFQLHHLTITSALARAAHILMWSFLWLASSLILIVLIDVPFQLMQHDQQLKMTRQEVKDEFKQTEGKPEVKAKIRRTQQEFARQRMMQEVPHADVVITNPTHFSVALKYDEAGSRAPTVLAKGQDLVALHIRDLAKKHDVICLECAPLTRAVYYSTELNQEIPSGLYLAVARVLAYVFQLKAYKPGRMRKPTLHPDLPIPDHLQH